MQNPDCGSEPLRQSRGHELESEGTYMIVSGKMGQKSGTGNIFFIFVCVWVLDMNVDMKH